MRAIQIAIKNWHENQTTSRTVIQLASLIGLLQATYFVNHFTLTKIYQMNLIKDNIFKSNDLEYLINLL